MAIYNDSGVPIRLTAYCGGHAPPGTKMPKMIVKGIPEGDIAERFYLVTNLGSLDQSIDEIHATIDALPEITLSPAELKSAWASMD